MCFVALFCCPEEIQTSDTMNSDRRHAQSQRSQGCARLFFESNMGSFGLILVPKSVSKSIKQTHFEVQSEQA